MLRRHSPKVLQHSSNRAKAGAVEVAAKNAKAQRPVTAQIVNTGKYAAANKLPADRHFVKPDGVHIYGGKLNAKNLPTFQSSKSGNAGESGVYASGRKAKPTGFGRYVGINTPKVGTKQAVIHRNGVAFWHHYGTPKSRKG